MPPNVPHRTHGSTVALFFAALLHAREQKRRRLDLSVS
jgi:hypothetical protein